MDKAQEDVEEIATQFVGALYDAQSDRKRLRQFLRGIYLVNDWNLCEG